MAAILTAPVNWLGFGASGAVRVREMSESALRIGPARSSARGGRLHPAVAAFEQRVVEQVAQPVERLAHRRLADPVVPGGAGDVPFGHQGVEHDQEIEIDAAQIPFSYCLHVFLPFPSAQPTCQSARSANANEGRRRATCLAGIPGPCAP